MIAPIMFLCRCPHKPIVSDRCGHLSSAPCTTAHLPPHETCPHRSPTGPIPSTRRFYQLLSPRPSKKPAVFADRPLTMGSSMRQKTEKNPRRAISTTRISRSCDRIDDRPAPIAMGRAEPIVTTSSKPECYPARPKKRGATQGLPRRSPFIILLSPKHA